MRRELCKSSEDCRRFIKSYFLNLSNLMNSIDFDDVNKIIEILDESRISGSRIFFIGNGGSAATAMHFANDLGAISDIEPRFKAISLVENIANITAVSNDHGYEYVFVRQLERLFEKGDILVAISASGNSRNIVSAIEYVNKKEGVTIALLGFDGGIAKRIAHYSIHVNSVKGEYGPAEDIHLILDHMITSYFTVKTSNKKENYEQKFKKGLF